MPVRLPRCAAIFCAPSPITSTSTPIASGLLVSRGCKPTGRNPTSAPRLVSLPSAAPHCRLFHASPCRRDLTGKNHYERLGIRHDASAKDIKKSFYALSKTHHPDVNPSDPGAARTFSLISESYTILSDPSRRATYDRDVLRLHHASSHVHHPARGSYSSTNPAGGRAPSGLSRRRGTFRGPPPSFYRSGGWGTQSDKRRKAHEESTGTGSTGGTADAHHNTQHHHQHGAGHHGQAQYTGPWAQEAASRGQYGGMGPGSNPFASHRADDHVPHFDRDGHTRTHQREDRRRSHRRRAMGDDDVEFEPQTSLAGHFFIVAGILGVTMLAPLVYLQFMRLGRKERDAG